MTPLFLSHSGSLSLFLGANASKPIYHLEIERFVE